MQKIKHQTECRKIFVPGFVLSTEMRPDVLFSICTFSKKLKIAYHAYTWENI